MSKKSSAASITPISFRWSQGNSSIYDIQGNTCTFRYVDAPVSAKEAPNAPVPEYYRPVLGSYEFKPNTGKYFWEVRVNSENVRIGLAEANCDGSMEMGKAKGTYAVNLQTAQCMTNSKVLKTLWRLVVPVSGGVFGFLYDSEEGTMQIYLNGEFHGTAFHSDFDLKGKTLFPCVGIAGVEINNRSIGKGQKCAIVVENPEPYSTLVLS